MQRANAAAVRLRIVTSAERAEIAGAEAFAAGASGIEEREEGSCIVLLVYAEAADAGAVAAALETVVGVPPTTEEIVEEDWPETWKEGLRPLAVSPRLLILPGVDLEHDLEPGRLEIVIEPKQAFGTGAHGSTALALTLLDARLAAAPGGRVLDVGAGSGVLAIAARKLGAAYALACDLDPIAARETAENAARNGVAVASFAGSVGALGPRAGRFEVVVANLISSEARPILGDLAARVAPGGVLILSGWLASERAGCEAALGALGLLPIASRSEEDALGDAWLALMATR
jgi:ribosomal protein L11 methyltransferase